MGEDFIRVLEEARLKIELSNKSEYVNMSKNCLHLWKPIGHELGELVEKRHE